MAWPTLPPYMTTNMKRNYSLAFCLLLLSAASLQAQNGETQNNSNPVQKEQTVPVTWESFVRAETHKMLNSFVGSGGFGKLVHIRALTPIEKQDVIRMNRDTRYSTGVFDLTTPLTITIPDTKGRFISMQVINEEEYTKAVKYDPGEYKLTKESVGTRYVCLIIRILVNGEDEKDNQIVTAIQNSIKTSQPSVGTFEIPNWDQQSQDKLRTAINVLASTLTDTRLCFGDTTEVDPVAHLLGAAYGWGGNPPNAAIYLNIVPEKNDGKTAYQLSVNNVPVDGFWSVSVYNKEGYFEKNNYNSYTVNSASAFKNSDGSVTIHFGGDDKQSNYIPITEGWNYIVRLYRAHKEIVDGTWKFPGPVIVR